jgi:hypothetical protein
VSTSPRKWAKQIIKIWLNRTRVSTFWWNPQDRSTNYWGSWCTWPDAWTSY